MAPTAFTDLVAELVPALGQRMEAVRPVPEGVLLQTTDGFYFAFLEDPANVSLATIQRLHAESGEAPGRLVVLTPGRLPLALAAEVLRRRGTVVEGRHFAELVRGLGLGEYLGQSPRPESTGAPQLLPSARQLDGVMQRGRTWMEWGVPALALRFYRQAAALKPEFTPARIGIGYALLGLGLPSDADLAFSEVLAAQPGDLEARLGRAAVRGASGDVDGEITDYRALLKEDRSRIAVRAHLIAALVAQARWPEASREISETLSATPEDPQMRFLHAVALEKIGRAREAAAEHARARALGLDPTRERALCEHLGLPPPDLPLEAPAPTPPPEGPNAPELAETPPPRSVPQASRPRRASARPTPKPRARSPPRRVARKPK